MFAPDELYPPAQYGGGWIFLALAIVVVVLVAALLVRYLTRPRPATAARVDHNEVAAALARLRTEYHARIDQIEAEYRAGRVDARRTNLELSRLVRRYVNEYSGIEAPVLTLDDLTERGAHPVLVDAIRRYYYPSMFRRGPIVDPIAGAGAAREVVTTWH